jgi:hypothetical protein
MAVHHSLHCPLHPCSSVPSADLSPRPRVPAPPRPPPLPFDYSWAIDRGVTHLLNQSVIVRD